jgi:uncharacterized protein YjbJ (UPF0337 family)
LADAIVFFTFRNAARSIVAPNFKVACKCPETMIVPPHFYSAQQGEQPLMSVSDGNHPRPAGVVMTSRLGNAIKGTMTMDKDRIEGSATQAKGAIKEAFGKVTGDAKTEAEGKADKAAGKMQNAVGGAKDAARDALNK